MPPELYVSTHVHTDGPIPGPHSLLTLASAAYTADGRLTSMFVANMRELPGATPHPTAVHDWRGRAEEWLCTRRASRPPAPTIVEHARWVTDLPGRATLVTDDLDHLFLYWYLQRFAGQWPYARTSTDAALRVRFGCRSLCSLPSCHAPLAQVA